MPCPSCGLWRVETWAEYERLPDDAGGLLCEGTQLGRFMNAEAGRWEGAASPPRQAATACSRQASKSTRAA